MVIGHEIGCGGLIENGSHLIGDDNRRGGLGPAAPGMGMLLRGVEGKAANESVRLLIGIAKRNVPRPDYLGTIPVNTPSTICPA